MNTLYSIFYVAWRYFYLKCFSNDCMYNLMTLYGWKNQTHHCTINWYVLNLFVWLLLQQMVLYYHSIRLWCDIITVMMMWSKKFNYWDLLSYLVILSILVIRLGGYLLRKSFSCALPVVLVWICDRHLWFPGSRYTHKTNKQSFFFQNTFPHNVFFKHGRLRLYWITCARLEARQLIFCFVEINFTSSLFCVPQTSLLRVYKCILTLLKPNLWKKVAISCWHKLHIWWRWLNAELMTNYYKL